MKPPKAWIALIGVIGALAVASGATAPHKQGPSPAEFRKQLKKERAKSARLARAIRDVPGLTPAERHLLSIAACESGGNPRAVSSGGHYRGKYQFDSGTWRSVGGTGDPAAATATEQARRARLL
jgi:hypothetical protein